MTSPTDVDDLSDLDDNELFARLGALSVGAETINRSGDDTDLIGRGQNWLERNLAKLRDQICDNDQIDKVRGDKALEIATIAEIIGTWAFGSSGALIIATILTRQGLDQLCATPSPTA